METESEFTIGETVVDFWGVTAREPNVEWIHTAEADGFYDLNRPGFSGDCFS